MTDRTIVAVYPGTSGIGTDPGWIMKWSDGPNTRTKRSKGEPFDACFDFDKVIRLTGVDHWKRTSRGNGLHFPHWIPDGASADRPCSSRVTVTFGRAPSEYKPCDAKAKTDGLCGRHARVIAQAAAKDQAYKDERDRSTAGRRIADDAVALAATVRLDDDRPVKVTPHYHVPIGGTALGGYTGEVRIHAEDLTAVIRRLQYLEQMTGGEL